MENIREKFLPKILCKKESYEHVNVIYLHLFVLKISINIQ